MCTAPQPSAIPQPPAQPEAIRAALAQVAPQLLADFDLPSLIVDTRDLHPREASRALVAAVLHLTAAAFRTTPRSCVWTGTAPIRTRAALTPGRTSQKHQRLNSTPPTTRLAARPMMTTEAGRSRERRPGGVRPADAGGHSHLRPRTAARMIRRRGGIRR